MLREFFAKEKPSTAINPRNSSSQSAGAKIAQRRRASLQFLAVAGLALYFGAPHLAAQIAPSVAPQGAPIAIVPVTSNNPDDAAVVTGAMEVTAGKAMIATSGSITSGKRTTDVILPRRGTLRVCASTTVKLAADTSVPAGGMPGLLMALDHGAVEMSFADTPSNGSDDIVMTPDFRILIGGPGASEVKVRLGREGDTCVDNSGAPGDGSLSPGLKSGAPGDGSLSPGLKSGEGAPYIVVTSLFESGLYRVQPGQRVLFEHGSLREVVDNEREPCGCPPPPATTGGNEFPLAQSEGLAPTPPVAPAIARGQNSTAPQVAPLVYASGGPQPQSAAAPPSAAAAPNPAPAAPTPAKPVKKKKPGPFARFGHFLRRIFGAE